MPKTPLKDIRCFVLDMDGTVYLGDRQNDIQNQDFVLLYFTKEDFLRCRKVLSLFKAGEPFDGEFTRGLAYRGVE